MHTTVYIYTAFESARLRYVFDFCFRQVWKLNYHLVSDIAAHNEGIHINYSSSELEGALNIVPHALLQETNIHPISVSTFVWKTHPAFFKSSDQEIPFDLFSAIFFLLCRYEEYWLYEEDEFGRYPYTESTAYKEKFLQTPLVDFWLKELKQILLEKFTIEAEENVFKFIPTYDIDIAYSYLGKGIVRNTAGLLKDAFQANFKALINRFKVLFFNKKDPYDCYDELRELHKRFKLNPIYFFLLSEVGPLDKNLPPDSSYMLQLINRIQSEAELGIHPSYKSNTQPNLLKQECNRIPGVIRSRQHYIKFTLPDTFRNLLLHHIKDEYSMGYGSVNGFRASTSFSHYWFDLEKNEATALLLHPFCFMECNTRFEQKQSPQDALTELQHYERSIREVGGILITIWHNFSIGTDPFWNGWREVYWQFVQDMIKRNR